MYGNLSHSEARDQYLAERATREYRWEHPGGVGLSHRNSALRNQANYGRKHVVGCTVVAVFLKFEVQLHEIAQTPQGDPLIVMEFCISAWRCLVVPVVGVVCDRVPTKTYKNYFS